MKQLLLALALFVELALLGALAGMVIFGGLPETLGGLLYAAGFIAAVSGAIAFALPGPIARKTSLHAALLAGATLFGLPFVWLVGTSFKYPEETFVNPPQWLPEVAHPRESSPYLLSRDDAEDISGAADDAREAIWQQTRVMLEPTLTAPFDESLIREAMVREVLVTDPGVATAEGPVATLARDRVDTLWNNISRAFVLGAISARNTLGESFIVPPDQLTITATGPATLSPTPGGQLVQYDFADADQFTLSIEINPDWIASTFTDTGDGELDVLAVRMRQDRTWHAYDAAVEVKGKRFKTDDSLNLGDFRWREVSFRPQTARAIADAPVGRDERNLGVFPAYPGGDAEPGTRVELTVHQTSGIAATWAKYTSTYRQAWYSDPYWGRYLFNSLLLVVLNVIGQIVACSMAAFAFSRLRWPGRDAVFLLLLSTMMLPAFVTMIPTFLIFRELGWYNTLLPLWVPAFFGTPFFIFLLRQFMMGIPRELEEAARIDGCGWISIYWRIVMPLMKPALATVAIFTFMATWNEFMAPLIYLSDERLYPLSLGLFKFRSQFNTEFGMLMAASTLMTLPVIAVFFLCQRYFIEGATLTGLKG